MLREATAAVFMMAAAESGPSDRPVSAPCRTFAEQIRAGLLVPRAEGAILGLKPVARMFFGDDAAKATGLRFVLFSDALDQISVEDPAGRKINMPYATRSAPVAAAVDAPRCSVADGRRLSCTFGTTVSTLTYDGAASVAGSIKTADRTCRLKFTLE